MKKSKIYMLLAALALPLMGCGSLGGSDSYGAVHVYGLDKDSRDVARSNWRFASSSSGAIEVDSKPYGKMILPSGTYLLLQSIWDCPICR